MRIFLENGPQEGAHFLTLGAKMVSDSYKTLHHSHLIRILPMSLHRYVLDHLVHLSLHKQILHHAFDPSNPTTAKTHRR